MRVVSVARLTEALEESLVLVRVDHLIPLRLQLLYAAMSLRPTLLSDDLLDLLDDRTLAVALLADLFVAITHELLALVKEDVTRRPKVQV